MAKKSKRRPKKNRIIAEPDYSSKENVINAPPPRDVASQETSKIEKEKDTTMDLVVESSKVDDNDATVEVDDLTTLVEQLSFGSPTRKVKEEEEREVVVLNTDKDSTIEIYEEVGEPEVEKQKENLKHVMEQAKIDLKNAGFPGIFGSVFDFGKDVVLAPTLDALITVVPPVASKIPFADEIGVFGLNAAFGAIKFGYGVVPHKETTFPSQ